MESEIPSWCALTVVAAIVRFKAFEIFATPAFFFASDFISRAGQMGSMHDELLSS
jgi:hypothetical protein